MTLGRTSALRGFLILLFALGLAALLDAEGLRKQAQIQPQGAGRRAALALTRPLVSVSRTLHLTTPRHSLQVAIGREHEDDIDSQVHLTLPPPAGPLPQPTPHRPHKPAAVPKPVFTRARPLRVWVAGDSLAQVPGDALLAPRRGASTCCPVESRLSTGLARPDLYNWYTRFNQVIAAVKPHVAVLSFGADDAHDFMAGVPGGRSVGTFGSPAWIAEYRRRVEGVTRELNAAGITTLWLGSRSPTARASDAASRSSTGFSSPLRASMRRARSSWTRGTCSTAPTAGTRRTCVWRQADADAAARRRALHGRRGRSRRGRRARAPPAVVRLPVTRPRPADGQRTFALCSPRAHVALS